MAHKSRLGCLVIDCKADELGPAAAFWSGALGYDIEMQTDDPRYAILKTPEGQPKMLLQAVNHDSRIHLDIETDDKASEVARLEALGARQVTALKGWIVMEAPTGHRFCVVKPQRADFDIHARNWNN
jgi:hypothetical protein